MKIEFVMKSLESIIAGKEKDNTQNKTQTLLDNMKSNQYPHTSNSIDLGQSNHK